MAVVVIVGTDKGGMLLRSDDARKRVYRTRNGGELWEPPKILCVEAFRV
jgi:hypothetical protein